MEYKIMKRKSTVWKALLIGCLVPFGSATIVAQTTPPLPDCECDTDGDGIYDSLAIYPDRDGDDKKECDPPDGECDCDGDGSSSADECQVDTDGDNTADDCAGSISISPVDDTLSGNIAQNAQSEYGYAIAEVTISPSGAKVKATVRKSPVSC